MSNEWCLMRPFQKCIAQVPSSIITGVIVQRVTRRSSQARFSGSNLGENSTRTVLLLCYGTEVRGFTPIPPYSVASVDRLLK